MTASLEETIRSALTNPGDDVGNNLDSYAAHVAGAVREWLLTPPTDEETLAAHGVLKAEHDAGDGRFTDRGADGVDRGPRIGG